MKISAAVLALVFLISTTASGLAAERPRPGPRPSPTTSPGPRPTATPTPRPTATATPTPRPIELDLSGARRSGHHDGQADGSREGNVRGPAEGDREGRERGFREGFDRCERDEKRKAYDIGYREGFVRGEYEGNSNGQREGEFNGRAEGEREGRSDGLARANRDAKNEAEPLGRARGTSEANQSDASERGRADGIASGDRDALGKAVAEDYTRGRKDVRDERFAEPIDSEDEFSQRSSAPGFAQKIKQGFQALLSSATASSAHPDRRFYNPRPRYNTPEERRAYEGGYSDGYNSGFHTNYRYAFDSAYDRARRLGAEDGCRSARSRSYDYDLRRGHADGHAAGYSRAYNDAYGRAHRYAYDQAFSNASQVAYRDSYQGYYNQHFEEARRAAYEERVGELYQAAYNAAYRKKFDEVYPGYAAEQYRRGQIDEDKDFELRPVRLLQAEATETIPNGLYEPGELLRIRVQLRNFADAAEAGKDVKIQLQALDSGSAVIGVAETVLSRGLKAKSLTRVSELLEFRLEEAAVGRAVSFRVTAFFQGRNIGEKVIKIVPHFVLGIALEGTPELHEGIEGTLAIRVKNQSQVPSDAGTRIQLSSDPATLEILDGAMTLGILNPGESRVIEFQVIARKGGSPRIPLVIEAVGAGSRRIGLLDQAPQIPVLNDYTIRLAQSLASLRKAGISRVEYVIRNVHSRSSLRGLQLHVKVTPKSGDPFAVAGPNPQYLNPLRNGQESSFLVPIVIRTENEGGVLELEVKENGRTVVIHRSEF